MGPTPFVRYLFEHVRCFCKPPPKGFEKYFEEGKRNKPAQNSSESSSKSDGDKSLDADNKSQQKSQQRSDWRNFGMFTQSRQQGSGDNQGNQGRNLGDGGNEDREKWVVLGAIAAAVFIGSFAFFEVGYKEISWKEFVIRFEKLHIYTYNNY